MSPSRFRPPVLATTHAKTAKKPVLTKHRSMTSTPIVVVAYLAMPMYIIYKIRLMFIQIMASVRSESRGLLELDGGLFSISRDTSDIETSCTEAWESVSSFYGYIFVMINIHF